MCVTLSGGVDPGASVFWNHLGRPMGEFQLLCIVCLVHLRQFELFRWPVLQEENHGKRGSRRMQGLLGSRAHSGA